MSVFRGTRGRWRHWFFARPVLAFVVELLVVAPLVLAADAGQVAAAYLFVFPFVVLALLYVNLPLLAATVRAFRIDQPTRRNHALEHATILRLQATTRRGYAGRSERDGFRIVGPASIKEIRTAFEHVRQTIKEGGRLHYISRQCGSNVITALGIGMTTLLVVAMACAITRPSLPARVAMLAGVVAFFFGLRHSIGNAIQRRYFTAIDFSDVEARDIRTARQERFDRGPAHFVRTVVRPK